MLLRSVLPNLSLFLFISVETYRSVRLYYWCLRGRLGVPSHDLDNQDEGNDVEKIEQEASERYHCHYQFIGVPAVIL